MNRDAVLRTLRDLFPTLQERYQIASLGIFGSVARGETNEASDLDVAITFSPDARPSLMTLAGIMTDIEDAVGRPVDLIEHRPDLRPRFLRMLERDLVRVA